MENPFVNLLVRAVSFLASLFLAVGVVLLLAGHFGFTANKFSGIVTTAFAAVLAVFSLTALGISNSRLRREMKHAAEVAYLLSNGEPYREESDSEVLCLLKKVSVYLEEKAAVAGRIGEGDLSVGVVPKTDSDVLGHSLNNMVEKLRFLVETREKRDELQLAVLKLLDEVSEVAAGDLTVQAEVRADITGSIAGAFNSMTQNLRSLIKQVKDNTVQVGASANAINETTEQLARGSVAQASQIARTTDAISGMAVQIQEVSENAAQSAKVAAESLKSARSGSKATRDNIDAMQCIRKQVQETAKRIKRLGERSQEISQIVGLIDDLSDRTSLLALNASLRASKAGESAADFSTVTEEVERLAERSSQLTRQISTLTQAINIETKEVVRSMEETIHEVTVGSALADKAGRSLVEIEQISGKLAELLRSISESAGHQAQSSKDISKAMESISEVTELVQNGSTRAASSVRTLVLLSNELRTSVAPFKLPAEAHIPREKAPENDLFVN